MIYLGNLSIEQIEREYCVLFSEEDKKWLLEHHQDKAEKIESDKWHFFDIPRVVIVGSQEFGRELYNRLTKYKFVGQFRIGVEE
jgi:hypothetical protein